MIRIATRVQHGRSPVRSEFVPQWNSSIFRGLLCVPGRVVNVSSFVGVRTLNQCSPALQERFRSEDITEQELVGLMQRFVDEAKRGEHKQGGWPDTSYGVSKTGLTVTSSVDILSTENEIKESDNYVFMFLDAVNDSGSPLVQGETE